MQHIQQLLHSYAGILSFGFALALGFALTRYRFIGPALTQLISKFLVRLFYPSLILSTIPSHYSRESLIRDWPIPLLAFSIILFGHFIGKFSANSFGGYAERDRGTFRFMCTMPNYIFLPLPICKYLWGEGAVAILVFSTLGADLAMWGLAVPHLRGNNHRIANLFNIPLLSLLAAALIVLTGLENLWQSTQGAVYLSQIGEATIPISLFLLGSYLGKIPFREFITRSHVFISLVRLVFVPSLTFILLWSLPLASDAKKVMLLVSAMPVAIASVILAEMYQGNPQQAAEQVLISHTAALFTTFFWLYVAIPILITAS